MDHLFFNGWQPLIHIAVIGLVAYVALIVLLRLSGKRTLSRMNAYDMVITMALGSLLTKAMLTADQSLSEALTAIFLLIAFQFFVSVVSCRWEGFRKLVSGSPAVLFHNGDFAPAAMRRERVTEAEIHAAVHEKGLPGLECVAAVILGANGELSVLPRPGSRETAPPRQGKI